jgi:phage terminase large subunit-like protein
VQDTKVRLPDLEPVGANITGPTWRRLKTGGWWLPERTLGWGVINWMVQYLRNPRDITKPFVPTLEQIRFLLWWYAVDGRGKYAYRNGILRRCKGWGKDPLLAAMCLAEMCGPVHFGRFSTAADVRKGLAKREGDPIGRPRPMPWIQVAAVSQDQTNNTFRMFPALISPKLKDEYGLDVNKTVIYGRDGGLIEAVTSSPLAMEGKRPTFVVLNEIQWWLETNSGTDMYGVIKGNITKQASAGGRFLAICNAHRPGENSVGEQLWDDYQAVQAGTKADTRVLYDCVEAPADTPIPEPPSEADDEEGWKRYEAELSALVHGLEVARGDAKWLSIEDTMASILEDRKTSESRRMYLNQVNAAEDAWITPQEWESDLIRDTTLTLLPKDRITLGFDGSKSDDWTALVACRVSDGALFLIKAWDPSKYKGEEVPRDDVDREVHAAFARYDVVAMRADLKEFEAYVDQWSAKYGRKLAVKATPGHPIAFDMRGQTKRFALDAERFQAAVFEGTLRHNGDKLLKIHVCNAHTYPVVFGQDVLVSIRKASKDSSRKIDAAVCAVLAFGARQEFLMSKKNVSRKAVVYR